MPPAGRNYQEHRICIVKSQVTEAGVPPDGFLIEQHFGILSQDSRVVAFQFRPEATQQRDSKSLRPIVIEES